jgi:serine/threonine-protein kinase
VVGATDRTLACPECGSNYLQGVKFCAECGVSLGSVDLDLGTLVGSYRLIEVLGEGGMGRVYVAEHVKLGRRVAIKKLRSELASNPTAVARFFSEARAVNRISHDNIVEITDFLEQPGGDNYIIMELLKGEDLAHRLQRKRILPLPRAFDIAAQTASALSAVHAAGMIHRDLKPDNIYLIERGGSPDFVKVLDFGVAKLTDAKGRGEIAVHVTAAGQIIGTPEYMSPEQAGGMAVDFRTDIYALGVILYEMITGDLPFQAKSFGELLIQHMTSPVELPSFSPGLPYGIQTGRDQLLLDLLAKNPKDRPRSMADIEQRIRGLIDSMDLPPPPRKRPSDPAAAMQDRAEPTPTSLARLALKKRPTPQVVVEIGTPRSVSRIEVPTPTSGRGVAPTPHPSSPAAHVTPTELPRPSAERLAKSSTDAQLLAAQHTNPGTKAALDADRAAAADARRSGRLQVTGSNPGISPPAGAAADGPRGGSIPAIRTPERAASPALDAQRGGSSPGIQVPDSSDAGPAASAATRTLDVPDPALETIRGWASHPAIVAPKRVRSSAIDARSSRGTNPALGSSPALGTPSYASGSRADDVAAGPEAEPVVEVRGATASNPVLATPVAPERRSTGSNPALVPPAAEPASARLSRPIPKPAPAAPGSRRALWIGGLAVVVAAAFVIYELRGEGDAVVVPAAPPAAAVAEVKIKFVSAPPGATVRLVDAAGGALGVTPFTQSFPRSARSLRIEFSKPGFTTIVEDLALVADDALAAALAPLASDPPAPPLPTVAPVPPTPVPARRPVPIKRTSPPEPERPVDRNGTLDVFKRK